MREMPILFSAPMVLALLDGRKTQTRRVVKPQPQMVTDRTIQTWDGPASALQYQLERLGKGCPYGHQGDGLWVQEKHYLHGIWVVRKDEHGKRRWTFIPNEDMGAHFGDPPSWFINGRSTEVAGWYCRQSIHMPRWASRITLEITGVRVERLQDISEADAKAEGVEWFRSGAVECPGMPETPIEAYRMLRESINGTGSWEANPWVWVIEFKHVKGGAP